MFGKFNEIKPLFLFTRSGVLFYNYGMRPKDKGVEIQRMLGEGASYNAIVSRLNCSKSTINYQAKQMGIAKSGSVYNWPEIQAFYDEGNSRSTCLLRSGFSSAAWADAVKRGAIVARERSIPMEELLVQDRPQTTRTHLKRRLLKAGLFTNHCYECGMTQWRGKPIAFNLHHINGDGKDNRSENLTLLCPNCHSQTENFAGRNRLSSAKKQSTPHPKELF